MTEENQQRHPQHVLESSSIINSSDFFFRAWTNPRLTWNEAPPLSHPRSALGETSQAWDKKLFSRSWIIQKNISWPNLFPYDSYSYVLIYFFGIGLFFYLEAHTCCDEACENTCSNSQWVWEFLENPELDKSSVSFPADSCWLRAVVMPTLKVKLVENSVSIWLFNVFSWFVKKGFNEHIS